MNRLLLGCLIGYAIAWGHAHGMVASECIRLGRFYVSDETFECRKIEDK
jgi:hypothetical protein